jgi:predicted nucleic acid-binding protein
MQYLLDTNICIFFFRDKFSVADTLKDFKYFTGIKIENWVKR